MNPTCSTCRQVNPLQARYCARCGQRLSVAGQSATSKGNGPWVAFLILLAVLFWGAQSFQGLSRYVNFGGHSRASSSVNAHLDLDIAKAEAVYELLAPRDIRVLVSRHGPRDIGIEGTVQEIDALNCLAMLVSRYENLEGAELIRAMRQAESGWGYRRMFKLPRQKADALYELLAFGDVPVLVQLATDGILVEGASHDLRTIERILPILRGRR